MFYDPGCFGRVRLGPLPADVQRGLLSLPGEWLEFDPTSLAIVVRHAQPSTAPSLPIVASELVRMVAEIPTSLHAAIPGGDLFLHTEGSRQLVRLRVEQGGALHIRWAHPEYAGATRRPWQPGMHDLVESKVQRLNGTVSLRASDGSAAAQALEQVADTFEGLYPEGDCHAVAADGSVTVTLQDVNLDAELLAARLQQVAQPRSLSGRIDVTSFAAPVPEHDARFVFEEGGIWIQRPVLWQSDS
jgi:hypothetical protein